MPDRVAGHLLVWERDEAGGPWWDLGEPSAQGDRDYAIASSPAPARSARTSPTGQPPAGGRCAMGTDTGIFLITADTV
jgi:hypothetical protein